MIKTELPKNGKAIKSRYKNHLENFDAECAMVCMVERES